LLVACAVAYTAFLVRLARRKPEQVPEQPGVANGKPVGLARQLLLIAAGLAMLVIGARLLVRAATETATAFGLSELVIGLTVVAVGTSLPEIATSILAAVRGERDLAVGNIVGSCIFNLLLVLGATALVAAEGVPVNPAALRFDLPVMTAVAVACLPIFFTGHCIHRWEGAVFVGYYVAYVAYLVMAAARHEALGDFREVMVYVVMPLTALTVAAVTLDSLKSRRQARGPGAP